MTTFLMGLAVALVLSYPFAYCAAWLAAWLAAVFVEDEDEAEEEEPFDEFAHNLQWAATAWPLHAGYFSGWEDRGKPFPEIYRKRGADQFSYSQSPLHRIMAGGHSSFSPEFRLKLWQNDSYRKSVAWVFSELDSSDVDAALRAATSMMNKAYGYWRPMIATILLAYAEGLMPAKSSLAAEAAEAVLLLEREYRSELASSQCRQRERLRKLKVLSSAEQAFRKEKSFQQ